MSNLSDLTKHREFINGLPDNEIKTINMPLYSFLQEAENLAVWAIDDIPFLRTKKYDETKIVLIQELAGACRHAQSLWNKELNSRSEARTEWKIERTNGFKLRDNLVRSFRFAFRNKPQKLKLIDAIDTGLTNSDMIQDLSDLAVIGKDNLNLLDSIVKLELLDKAEKLSDNLATVFAKANGDIRSTDSTKKLRDKAYSVLKIEVDELREYGKFIFANNNDRLKGYISNHWKNRNKE